VSKSKTKIKNGRDVTRILKQHGCPIRNGKGSHRIATLPNGVVMTYHEHGEYKAGIRNKIVKTLARAGLVVVLLSIVIMYALIAA